MASKTKNDQYLVQAYKSPYSKRLFGLHDEAAFDAHLRAEEKIQRDKDKALSDREFRLNAWRALREQTNSIHAIPALLSQLPVALYAYYKEISFFTSRTKKIWSLSFVDRGSVGLQSISHNKPVGQAANWGAQDKNAPSALLGLKLKTFNSVNHAFPEASAESGISAQNDSIVLFADDWPFVAKLVLQDAFDNKLETPKNDRATFERYAADLNKYSLNLLGMQYSVLTGLRDGLGLTREQFDGMLIKNAAEKSNIFKPISLVALDLPDGIENDPHGMSV